MSGQPMGSIKKKLRWFQFSFLQWGLICTGISLILLLPSFWVKWHHSLVLQDQQVNEYVRITNTAFFGYPHRDFAIRLSEQNLIKGELNAEQVNLELMILAQLGVTETGRRLVSQMILGVSDAGALSPKRLNAFFALSVNFRKQLIDILRDETVPHPKRMKVLRTIDTNVGNTPETQRMLFDICVLPIKNQRLSSEECLDAIDVLGELRSRQVIPTKELVHLYLRLSLQPTKSIRDKSHAQWMHLIDSMSTKRRSELDQVCRLIIQSNKRNSKLERIALESLMRANVDDLIPLVESRIKQATFVLDPRNGQRTKLTSHEFETLWSLIEYYRSSLTSMIQREITQSVAPKIQSHLAPLIRLRKQDVVMDPQSRGVDVGPALVDALSTIRWRDVPEQDLRWAISFMTTNVFAPKQLRIACGCLPATQSTVDLLVTLIPNTFDPEDKTTLRYCLMSKLHAMDFEEHQSLNAATKDTIFMWLKEFQGQGFIRGGPWVDRDLSLRVIHLHAGRIEEYAKQTSTLSVPGDANRTVPCSVWLTAREDRDPVVRQLARAAIANEASLTAKLYPLIDETHQLLKDCRARCSVFFVRHQIQEIDKICANLQKLKDDFHIDLTLSRAASWCDRIAQKLQLQLYEKVPGDEQLSEQLRRTSRTIKDLDTEFSSYFYMTYLKSWYVAAEHE